MPPTPPVISQKSLSSPFSGSFYPLRFDFHLWEARPLHRKRSPSPLGEALANTVGLVETCSKAIMSLHLTMTMVVGGGGSRKRDGRANLTDRPGRRSLRPLRIFLTKNPPPPPIHYILSPIHYILSPKLYILQLVILTKDSSVCMAKTANFISLGLKV